MRIVALGGAGYQGTVAVRDMVKSGVSEVVIADYNIERARMLSSQLTTDKTKVSAEFIDANDYDSMVKVLKGADAASSSVGPFFKYGVKILKAALDAKVNLVDIDDDYDSIQESLELHQEAQKAGVTIIVGLGWTPGLSNVLARYGADKLDQVDEIGTYWCGGMMDPAGLGVTAHFFHIMSGKTPIFRDGKWVDVEIGSEKEVVEFLEPFGQLEVVIVGHPEPVTIPRYIKKGLKVVFNKGRLIPTWMDEFFSTLAQFGFSSSDQIKLGDVAFVPADVAIAILRNVNLHNPTLRDRIAREAPPLSGSTVIVKGKKNGKETQYIYQCNGQLRDMTGLPLSVAAQMLARGDFKEKGVFAPEGCVDPGTFLAECSKRGIEFYEREKREGVVFRE